MLVLSIASIESSGSEGLSYFKDLKDRRSASRAKHQTFIRFKTTCESGLFYSFFKCIVTTAFKKKHIYSCFHFACTVNLAKVWKGENVSRNSFSSIWNMKYASRQWELCSAPVLMKKSCLTRINLSSLEPPPGRRHFTYLWPPPFQTWS